MLPVDSSASWIEGPLVPSSRLSTPAAKALVALTGFLLIVFLLAHMVGNLLIFKGSDSLNTYAAWLKSQTPLLWTARLGLLAVFVTHLSLATMLAYRSSLARPDRYVYHRTQVATASSRYMFWSGIVILAFVIYHLAHFTMGWTHSANGNHYNELLDNQGRPDVYRMVIVGFSNFWIAGFYILCQLVLASHLCHGASSMFQTWGFYSTRYQHIIRRIGLVIAAAIAIGNCSIPISILLGWFK